MWRESIAGYLSTPLPLSGFPLGGLSAGQNALPTQETDDVS